jgi:tetratricopeptide (TPR) repeat protein
VEIPAIPAISPDPAGSWRKHAKRLLIPWSLALLAYVNSFSAGLTYDNRLGILEDARVHAATDANIKALLTQDFWSSLSTSWLYRPLTKLSYLFNYAVLGNGPHPAGYHVVNFFLHALNILLVYLCALILFEHLQGREVLAIATATVWAVHPVLTEAVTNVVGRADLLAAIGVLGGLVCHVKAASARGRTKVAWLALLAGVVAVGIFSKENAIVVVAVMAIYDAAYRPRTWRSGWLGYLAALAPLVLYLFLRYHFLSTVAERLGDFGDNPLLGAGFLTARMTAIGVLGKYLGLLLWPASLSCDYSYNQWPLMSWRFQTAADWLPLVAMLVYLAILAGAIACYRRHRELFFLGFFFFVTLAPVSNVFLLIGTIMGERLLYLPAVAFAGCVAIALDALCRRIAESTGRRYVTTALLAVICLGLAVRTYVRNSDWHDDLSLWRSAELVSPASYRAHFNVAYWLIAAGNPNESEVRSELDKTVAILDPLPPLLSEPKPYINTAAWFRNHGDARGALALLDRARTVDDAQTAEMIRFNRTKGKIIAATGNALLQAEMGQAYSAIGENRKALDAFKLAREIEPDPKYSAEIAKVYRSQGDWHNAAIALMEGLWLDPNQSAFASELMDLYRSSDPQSCAIADSSINMSCPEVRDSFCDAARNVVSLHLAAHRSSEAAKTRSSATGEFGCK